MRRQSPQTKEKQQWSYVKSADGSTYVSTQEEHAELSAQFAAHWGNDRFAQLRPYDTMVFATTYHDSGYREWEGLPRMDVEKGRPYGHRERIPGFEATELKAYRRNVEWVRGHDLYAGMLVSMHRTGLWRGRYDVLTSAKPRVRDLSSGVQTVLGELEDQQQAGQGHAWPPETRDSKPSLWINYRMLQLFDLLSLYFCCDGYGTRPASRKRASGPHSRRLLARQRRRAAHYAEPGRIREDGPLSRSTSRRSGYRYNGRGGMQGRRVPDRRAECRAGLLQDTLQHFYHSSSPTETPAIGRL